MSHLPVAGFCRGGRVKLAETCQAGNSTPRFLAAQRSAVSSRREEVAFVALAAQHNTRVCGPLCDPMGSSQVVLTLSGSPTVFYWYSRSGLQLQPGLQFVQRSDCRAADLAVFRRRKAFLLCKNPCGGTAVGMGSPPQSRDTHRPRKEISRGNLLCAASGLANLSYPRRLSAQKYVTTPDWKNFCTGQPWVPEGPRSLCFGEESRGTLQGVPLGNFFAEARHRASFRR